jgi:hypothetical protein
MFYAIAFAFLAPFTAICQVPVKSFNTNTFNDNYFSELRKVYGYKKEYPAELEKQVLIALSYYPELMSTPIKFQHRPNHSPGFARVTWGGLFESPRKRHFLIVISDHTEELLMPLIFKNVSFDAQIGLIGHELAHVSSFLKMTSLGIIKHVFSSLSPKYLDKFEGNTDAICIDHGLGYQLLAWSTHVRKEMKAVNWDGPDHVHRSKKRNRYMNPDAILKKISMIPLYQASR